MMKLKGAIVKNKTEVDVFDIEVHSGNYELVRKKLESEKNKIISNLREYKKAGLIKSENCPKNKTIQKELNHLVESKKQINKSIMAIKKIFR